MIYALLSRQGPDVREKIARAIHEHRDVGHFVQEGIIVHVMHANPGKLYRCIYCPDQVRLANLSRVGTRPPAHDWYFMHVYNPECIGTSEGLGSDLENPAEHGCYIQLGCEFEPDGRPSAHHRTRCATISADSGSTYCHLAQMRGCVPRAGR